MSANCGWGTVLGAGSPEMNQAAARPVSDSVRVERKVWISRAQCGNRPPGGGVDQESCYRVGTLSGTYSLLNECCSLQAPS